MQLLWLAVDLEMDAGGAPHRGLFLYLVVESLGVLCVRSSGVGLSVCSFLSRVLNSHPLNLLAQSIWPFVPLFLSFMSPSASQCPVRGCLLP